LDKGNKLKEALRRLTKEEEFVCFLQKKKEENECEREELVFMCEKVLFMVKNNCVQTKSMEGSYVYQVVVVEFMEGFP
jgi:hypothetical protein